MNEQRPKWRFSIRAALAATLGLCIGLSLMRLGGLIFGQIGLGISAGAAGAFLAHARGKNPFRGAGWGIVVAVATLMALGPILYALGIFWLP